MGDAVIAIALLVRHPVPGRVKTRLACDVGETAACELYRAMVADVVANSAACGLPLYLFHDGLSSSGLPIEWAAAAAEIVVQRGDSLGERMTSAFEYLFSVGCERVVLCGSDIPGIDAPLLYSAIAALDDCDAVFSPALDGGYCLVASKKSRFRDVIFRNIPWSTPSVLETTLESCRSADISYTLLEPRQDIDTRDDVTAYCRCPSPTASSTNHWLAAHGYLQSSAPL